MINAFKHNLESTVVFALNNNVNENMKILLTLFHLKF